MKRINNIAVRIGSFIGGVISMFILAYLGFGPIIRLLVPLLLIFYVGYKLYRLWQEKQYKLIKHIMVEAPIFFVIGIILNVFEMWYTRKPVVINFTSGFLVMFTYFIVRIALYRTKQRRIT